MCWGRMSFGNIIIMKSRILNCSKSGDFAQRGNKLVKEIKKTKFKKQYLRFFKLMKKFEQLLKIRFTKNNDFMMRKKRT